MGWDGKNRRQFPRIAYPCLVKIVSANKTRDAYLTHTENIGVGGVGIIAKHEIPILTKVEIEIDLLDGQEHVIASGKVAWAYQRKDTAETKPSFYDIGLEFDNLDPADKARLEKTTQNLIKKGYKVLKPVF